MKAVQDAMQVVMKKVVPLLPDGVVPGGSPDPLLDQPQRVVGVAVSRLDGAAKVRGEAKFAAEFSMDGMLYAALVFSTVPSGRILSIDTTAALAAPGVALVMTHENAPRLKAPTAFLEASKSGGGSNLPVMQDDRIHWNGQPVAIVLADTQLQADHAATLIRPQYETLPSVTSFEPGKALSRPAPMFVGESLQHDIGEPLERLAGAPHRVDEVYATPRHNHNAMELHAVTLAWKGDDELRVHDASQSVGHTAWTLAEVFGLKEQRVHVTSPFVGGGFGGKVGVWQHHVLAAAASKLAGRPVRLVLTREGVYRIVGGRTTTEQRVALGAGDDGRLQAVLHTGHVAMTPYNQVPEAFVTAARHLYASPAFRFDVRVVDMNMVANAFMRAPGEAVGTFALESAMDELAHKMGIDPVELRLRNEPTEDPTRKLPFSSRNLVKAYRDGAERFGWNKRRLEPRSHRDGEWWVGMGVASGFYPYFRMPGGAVSLKLDSKGGAHVAVAAHEMGMGTSTTVAIMAAERLGLPLDRVKVNYGSSTMPGLVIAGGSQQTVSIGVALMAAQKELFKKLLKETDRDSPLHGLDVDDVQAVDSGLQKHGAPETHRSYATLLAGVGSSELVVDGTASMPLESEHWSMATYSSVFCEVRVNAVTAEVRIARLLGSFDCGRVMNPKTAASQLRGGMVMGIGMALMEETQFDERNGRIVNASLWDYHVAAHADVPPIDVMWTDIPDPHTPLGARGLGEIGITGTSAAIANAVFNATGRRVRELPITLDKLLG